jgi:hypothetical protein
VLALKKKTLSITEKTSHKDCGSIGSPNDIILIAVKAMKRIKKLMVFVIIDDMETVREILEQIGK